MTPTGWTRESENGKYLPWIDHQSGKLRITKSFVRGKDQFTGWVRIDGYWKPHNGKVVWYETLDEIREKLEAEL